MLAALFLAAEAAEKSKTPFYVLAAMLVAFALIVGGIGASRHETFPPSQGVFRALIGLGVLLVAGTMFTAVITA